MYADWITSSNGLPREGQQIEFMLDFRDVAMKGSYTHQVFHSHWAEYEVDRVRSWRNLRQECDLTIPAPYQAASAPTFAPSEDFNHHLWPAGGLAHAA